MEEEIKQEVTEEVQEVPVTESEPVQEEVKVEEKEVVEVKHQEIEPKRKEKKKKGLISKIIAIILWILVLIVLASVILGLINFNRISNNEEPIAVLDTRKIEETDKNVTIYDFGIYRIEKEESAQNTTISLKPFFMSENK